MQPISLLSFEFNNLILKRLLMQIAIYCWTVAFHASPLRRHIFNRKIFITFMLFIEIPLNRYAKNMRQTIMTRHVPDKPRNVICWALRYSNVMESDATLDDRWKKKRSTRESVSSVHSLCLRNPLLSCTSRRGVWCCLPAR